MLITAPELSDLPAVRHAFFTREGGVSTGVYASLNGGPGSGDAPDAIGENRRRMAEHLGVSPGDFLALYQIHSAAIITVDEPWAPDERPRADAMVTRRPGIALTIATADCGPVLFADAAHRVIGAAHAGWKGTLSGVIEATLSAMEALGAERQAVVAVLGPTITQRSYEVGPEFPAPFVAQNPEFRRFFTPNDNPGHFLFDLPGLILHLLRQADVASASFVNRCTYQEDTLFFSYRRSVHRKEADYGRIISAICLA
ncbi:MAG: peptidoglycan editing factor PgeF [Methylobacteriaceae bacterium]|jgi:YfiH family protein|nr:peptidoglycan editing factor PgeF [Methylobacteriaceae bacterium]